MGQWEEDAGCAGDHLADLVEAGLITDRIALRWFAGDREAWRLVDEATDRLEAAELEDSQP